MALIILEEPHVPGSAKGLSGHPLFALGFRPFYLLAAAFVIYVAVYGRYLLSPRVDGREGAVFQRNRVAAMMIGADRIHTKQFAGHLELRKLFSQNREEGRVAQAPGGRIDFFSTTGLIW
jgi:hypothetical protein